MEWRHEELDGSIVEELSDELGVSKYLANLLVRKGIKDAKQAERFLNPRLAYLENPFEITHLKEAVVRLLQAIDQKEKVLVVGDYDVDGVTSTTFLVAVLKKFGLSPHYIIPRRFDESYGLTRSIIDRGLEGCTPTLLVALDCGTNSVEEITYLKDRGCDAIVVDHHRCRDQLSESAILVNPHVFDGEDKPWSQLCTVGLVFKLVHGLFIELKAREDPLVESVKLKDFLDLVAMGTVADLVFLQDENRILTRFGLKLIQGGSRPGVEALCDVSGMGGKPEIKPVDIAFRLGPRINASGRLGDALLPVEMLLSQDRELCRSMASELDDLNKDRQDIERAVTIEAEEQVEPSVSANDLALVAYNPDWHSGIVGIVAGKLSRDFYRPAIVFGTEGGLAKGSGRSIPEVDLIEALGSCADLLESWGGHPMAAGVSLQPSNLEAFRKRFNESVRDQLNGELPSPFLKIADWLPVHVLDGFLLEDLDRMQPFGSGNSEPVFGVKSVIIKRPPMAFGHAHFRFELYTGRGSPVGGVAWKMADRILPCHTPVDLAVKFSWNYWNGSRAPQLQLIDWRLA